MFTSSSNKCTRKRPGPQGGLRANLSKAQKRAKLDHRDMDIWVYS